MSEHESDAKASIKFKLMMIIVDEADTERVTHFLRERLVKFQYACVAEGTADTDLQALLGFTGTQKSLFLSLLPDFHAEEMMRVLPDQLDLHKRGKGIAFTLPLSGICNLLLHVFNDEMLEKITAAVGSETSAAEWARRPEKERISPLENEIVRHDLILAVVNHGCSEEVMATAKAHGAGGGTILNARRTGLEDNASFLGIPVQKQKEIVLILTEQKQRSVLMKAINHAFGLNTPARGIILSLPVDSVAGLHSMAAGVGAGSHLQTDPAPRIDGEKRFL